MPAHARVRLLDPGPRLGEPAPPPGPHPDHPDDVRPGREPDRHRRRAAGRHRRVPGARASSTHRSCGSPSPSRPPTSRRRLIVGVIWATNRVINNVRWAIEERTPTRRTSATLLRAVAADPRAADPLGRRHRRADDAVRTGRTPTTSRSVLLGISFPGIVVSASCYLFTEFALRPVAAQALEVGPPPRRFAPGIMGRTMLVWALGRACRCSASCWPRSSRCRCET